jgi:hypothetical protein
MEIDGHAFIEVCYGTSKFKQYRGLALVIANLSDMYEMGLPQATVFELERTAVIPWAKEWVGSLDGHGPAIGRLNNIYRERLAHLMSRKKK